MREEPIISGWLVKLLLAVMVVAGIGFGAYRVVDGLDIDLEEIGDGVTSPASTELEGSATGSGAVGEVDGETEPPAGAGPMTAEGLEAAIERIRGELGGGARLTRLTIDTSGTQFYVLRGETSEAWNVPVQGEVGKLPATVTITGDAEIGDFAFALAAVEPAAITRLARRAARSVEARSLTPTTLSLERALPFGRRALEWTLNARRGSRSLTFRASADGRRVENVGGGGVEVPDALLEAERLNRCITEAEGDSDRIFECLDRFGS